MGYGSMARVRADLPLALLFLRLARGWTQRQLAAQADSTRAAISRYESGKQRPTPRTLRSLLEALDFPAYALEDTVTLIVRLRGRARL